MVWWDRRKKSKHAAVDTRLVVPSRDERVLTAAAQTVNTIARGRTRITPKYDGWQRELWDYYDTLGEFNISVTWRSYMISRVRLRAARLKPGSDEPEIVDVGPAADFVNELCRGTAGQTEMLGSLSVYLDVPADNTDAIRLAEAFGLLPVFETARMYRGEAPQMPLHRVFAVTTLELG